MYHTQRKLDIALPGYTPPGACPNSTRITVLYQCAITQVHDRQRASYFLGDVGHSETAIGVWAGVVFLAGPCIYENRKKDEVVSTSRIYQARTLDG